MLKYLIEKEFKQFLRNSFLPRLVVFLPLLLLLVLPWAADMTTKNVNLVTVDRDRSPLSSRLIDKIAASDYFNLRAGVESYDRAMELVEIGDADIILEIPAGFERDLVKTGLAQVLISANTVNATKGLLGSTYLSVIVSSFADEAGRGRGGQAAVSISRTELEVIPRVRYNPTMDYKKFMVPAFIVVIMTLVCGFLPALNVVMEKEAGTIEQINVTPVSKLNFIVAKLIPYWVMGVFIMFLSILIARVVYGIYPVGSLWAVFLSFVVYVVALSGFGIVISNYSATMQQAMLLMFFFLIIFILMSGIFTPISSMPGWARAITLFNPLRYFIEIMRSIFFKGSTIADLGVQYLALVLFAAVSNVWAVLSYRKNG